MFIRLILSNPLFIWLNHLQQNKKCSRNCLGKHNWLPFDQCLQPTFCQCCCCCFCCCCWCMARSLSNVTQSTDLALSACCHLLDRLSYCVLCPASWSLWGWTRPHWEHHVCLHHVVISTLQHKCTGQGLW